MKNEASRAARYQAAFRLGPNELDRSTGRIDRPRAPLDEQFDAERRQLDESFERWFEYAGPPLGDVLEIKRMSERLSLVLDRLLVACSPQGEAALCKKSCGLKYEPLFRSQVL